MTLEFVEFPKMARLSREIIVTEKLDGTNAQINIEEIFKSERYAACQADPFVVGGVEGPASALVMRVGSRTRWIRPGDDNFAFALWAKENAQELITKLGPGSHFGEWYGRGIQRGYGLDHRRFALFNTHRWGDPQIRPACTEVVPVLYRGNFDTNAIENCLDDLALHGSKAAPGFMAPEGVVVYHIAGGVGFKKTIHKDEVPTALAA